MSTPSKQARIIFTRRDFVFAASAAIVSASAHAVFAQTSTAALDPKSAAQTSIENDAFNSIAILFGDDVESGTVEVTYADLDPLEKARDDQKAAKPPGDFRLETGSRRLAIHLQKIHVDIGARATRITVRFKLRNSAKNQSHQGFTFFLRDVRSETPIIVRGLKVAVVKATDSRTFEQIDTSVKAKKLKSQHEVIDAAPDDNYELACHETKSMRCPTWLGVGRDMRIFRVMPLDSVGYWGFVEPYDLINSSLSLEDLPRRGRAEPNRYTFILGRGAGCKVDIVRRLEDGVLPIIKSTQIDGDIEYQLTIFATLEKEPLKSDNVRGTHWLATFANSAGAMLTKEEQEKYKEMTSAEVTQREQELICWVQVDVINKAAVPRYAYVKAGYIKADALEGVGRAKFKDGFRTLASGNVMAINQIDGQPMPQEEMAVLLQPGEKITLDLRFPHRPLTPDRAIEVRKQSYDAHYKACREFWQYKLNRGAKISLPEPAIEERIRAGLLHLDILTLGHSEEGPLATPVGWYAPIGSESAPIIQFYDSLGYHDLAERAIQFFLDRQRADGFIQTCLGYQLETGPVLWTIGEHFRYTRDEKWARKIQDNVLRACNYIIAWRRRNMKEELRGKGYGLLEGKVADPQDFYHSYMLNALAYIGLKRAVEVYRDIDAKTFAEVEKELAPYLSDIRNCYADNVIRSPVLPLGDGSWVPTFSPWAEYAGPVSLYADGGSWLSHFMFASRDSLIGALHMGIGEVLDPNEQLGEWLLHAHQELMTDRNAGYSQPYYCRHDWLHLKRGEPKQFLKTYYSQFASLQDRETYTFWEHYVGVGESQHKTHEEGWFLMQSRWMLWHEDYETRQLNLLSMIPRNWLEAGKEIKLENCKSYYGSFSLIVRASKSLGTVEAMLDFHGPAKNYPRSVAIRVPHPAGKKPANIDGGKYDPKTETIVLNAVGKSSRIFVRYS